MMNLHFVLKTGVLTMCLALSVPLCCSAALDQTIPLTEMLDQKVYEAPAVHPYPSHDLGDIKAVMYETLSYKGKPTRTFAYIGIPKSDKPVPAMVLVHGGGGTAFMKWVKIWNDRGYAAIAMDLEGRIPDPGMRGKGRLAHDLSGPTRVGRFDDADLPLEAQWMYHAVSDIFIARSLLASMPGVDADRIGITGISWGGILSSLVSGIDPRYKCAAPVYGCGFLYESYGHFSDANTEAKKFWDPARHFAGGSVPTLWVNGDTDAHFSINCSSRSFETTSDRAFLSIHHGLVHGHPPGWDIERVPEIYAFVDHILKGEGAALGRIVKQPSTRAVELTYESEISVESATVYYLNEPITYRREKPEDKHSRPGPWLEMTAELNTTDNTVRAQLPDSCMTYYVNLKDARGYSISSVLVELD